MRQRASTRIMALHLRGPTKLGILSLIIRSGARCCWGCIVQRREGFPCHAQVVVDHPQPCPVCAPPPLVRPPARGQRLWHAPDLTAGLSTQTVLYS